MFEVDHKTHDKSLTTSHSAINQDSDDKTSTFSYDGEADPDTLSFHQLRVAVDAHFGVPCSLHKVSEGGYHKVYEALRESDNASSLGIVRVAAPAFPKDKLESEIATLRYLAANTQIPVPRVYKWNSDASNPVGAEYMIMQKVPGVSADKVWDNLTMDVKERVVVQVAAYLKAMFALRFDHAGSLYLSSESPSTSGVDVDVGRIVSTPFYRALDGVLRAENADTQRQLGAELSVYRGPFSTTTEYLQSFLHAELHIITHHRAIVLSELQEENEEKEVAETQLERGERTLRKALDLCAIYPGETIPGTAGEQTSSAETTPFSCSFSLRLDDFRLSNLMIDDSDTGTGNVTGLIDFEATTIAPLWECTVVPRWLQDPEDAEGSYEGGSAADRKRLRDVFWKAMDSESDHDEWRMLYEHGKPFRRLTARLGLQVGAWLFGDSETWVDERLAWATLHPGVGLEEGDVVTTSE